MGIRDEILRITGYIEANLGSPMSIDAIAAQCYVSKYHLLRVFKSLTGQTIGEYIRSRRLASSLTHLVDSGLRIADIACECGFADGASYTHAFTREYGISPSAFRQSPRELKIVEKLSAYDLYGNEYGIITRPHTVMKAAFSVIGVRHRIVYGENAKTNKANRAGVDFFYGQSQQIASPTDRHVYIGLTLFPTDDDTYTWYIPSLEADLSCPVPAGMERLFIPAQSYAVFHYVGLHDPSQLSANMNPLHRHVFLDWMPRIGTSISMNFERIDERFCSADYCEADLYYALGRTQAD